MQNRDKFAIFLNTLVIGLFVVLIFAQAGKKFVLDEIDFPIVAQATSQSALPIYYRGEQQPEHLGIYHPPLYIYSLAGFIKAVGFSENTIRAFGMLCTLITAFLCTLIFDKLFPHAAGRKYFVSAFLSLFLLHPYTLANTTLPDIDQTVLPITVSLFVFALLHRFPLRRPDEQGQTRSQAGAAVLVLSMVFALNLWAKLTTPLALLPTAFFILLALRYSAKKSTGIVASIAIAGMVLFLATYWAYCRYAGLPFDYTFQFLLHSFTKGTSSSGGLWSIIDKVVTNFAYSKQFVNWLTIPFVFAFFLSLAFLTLKSEKSPGENVLLIISFSGLFVTLFYLSLIAPFGHFFKYPYAVFAFLVLPIAYWCSAGFSSKFTEASDKYLRSDHARSALKSTVALGSIFVFVFIPATLYQLAIAKDSAIREDQPLEVYLLLGVIAAAVTLGFLASCSKILQLARYAAVAVLAIVLGGQIGIARSQAVAKYPTKYSYGQHGLDETVAYLKTKVAPDEIIWSMKDVGFYVNNKYIENYVDIFSGELEERLDDLSKTGMVRYFVVTKGVGEDRVDAYPALKRGLESCCTVEQEFGNFVIYKAKTR
jgi:hypothetical protein